MDPVRWLAQGRHVDFRGHAVFVVDSAPGDSTREALLLVHGFPTAGWDWVKVLPALSARWRVIVPDLLGFGYSARPRQVPCTIALQADLCEALLDGCGIGDCHLLAHDYGDTVAQELLARDLERARVRFRSCCFLNGGLFPETHRARPVQRLLASPLGPLLNRLAGRRSFERSLRAVFGPQTPPSRAELDGFWALANHGGGTFFHRLIGYMAERRTHRARWVGALQQARVPLAVIDGSADPVSGAHMVARWREVVGHGHLVELPGIGHYPQIEAPEAVLAHYLAWRKALPAWSPPATQA